MAPAETETAAGDSSPLELSIVVPCYNEELNVPELSERVLLTLEMGKLRGELVLVDDGSKDRTAEVIREQAAAHPGKVVGVFHEINGGMAKAWRSGVEAARGVNIALIDADLQYQPEDVLRLLRTLRESSVDIVQGWRSSVGRLRDGRYLLSRGLNTILNRAFNMNLRDNKSGFLCCSKEVLLDLFRYEGRYAYWQSFIMVAAHARGYSYREIETLFAERKQGTSFLDGHAYRAAAKNMLDVGNAFWEYRLQRKPLVTRHDVPTEPRSSAPSPSRARFAPTMFVAGEATVRRRRVDRKLERLEESQWFSPEQLRELQAERLRRLVRHAYGNVPYYRARMRELKLHPDDIRRVDDLEKLPLITKDEIRKHLYFDIMQEGVSHADLVRITTSGNTGEPFV
jgi:phenylacetate-CoA ligase